MRYKALFLVFVFVFVLDTHDANVYRKSWVPKYISASFNV